MTQKTETVATDKSVEVLGYVLGLIVGLIGYAVILGSVAMYSAFWEALVGFQFWKWFMVPLGQPEINGWHIAGLGLFISMLRYGSKKIEEVDDWAKQILHWIVYPPLMAVVFLVVGYLVAHLANLA